MIPEISPNIILDRPSFKISQGTSAIAVEFKDLTLNFMLNFILSLPLIKLGSSANSAGAMSVARLLLLVTLTQLAITSPLLMAAELAPPFSLNPPPAAELTPPFSLITPPAAEQVVHIWSIIVGVVVAAVFVKFLVIVAGLWYCLRKKRERDEGADVEKAQTPPQTPPDVEGLNSQVPAVSRPEALPAPMPEPEAALHMEEIPNVLKYSYAEAEAISNNWMDKLGEGGFGMVYYGEIFSDTSPNANPQKVALKRLSATSQQGKDEFFNEVRLLSRIHYRYLVPLVGFCDEINNQVLIYEYMQEGSLADWLHGAQRDHSDFNWYSRLCIALHAALGLDYLHVGARPNIIHRDVKSSNILITRKWEGRVADFGLSKTNGVSDQQRSHFTLVKGTPGYLDPEYLRTSKLTTKSDVYSFGIVLLELVTGRLPIVSQLQCIGSYVRSHYPNNLATIADPNLKGNYEICSMQKIVEVALRSIALQGTNRPTMGEVVDEIRSAMKLVEVGRDNPATINSQDSRPLLDLEHWA